MSDYSTYLAENNLKIDVNKSIKKQRLSYIFTLGEIFTMSLSYILGIVVIGLLLLPVWLKIKGSNVSFELLFFCLISNAWLISNIILNNALIKIEGHDIAKNRIDMISILNRYYSNLDIQIDQENLIRSFKSSYQPIWGRVITVIFDDNVIYLNITKLGKSDSPTFVHGLFNYLKAKRIAKYYRENYF